MLGRCMQGFLLISIYFFWPLSDPALAQKSTNLVERNPVEQYELIKRSLREVYERDEWPADGAPMLIPCNGPGMRTNLPQKNRSPDDQDFLEFWAQMALMWEHNLSKLGYPELVWKETLHAFERRIVHQYATRASRRRKGVPYEEWSKDAGFEQVIRDLSTYRATMNPNLEPIGPGGECGDGEIPVKLKASLQGQGRGS
jgi:hypothetical protein